jgi:phosphatidylglycerol lysyltransferase
MSVLVGFFLLVLSGGLARGKHQAWLLTVVLLVLSTGLQFLRGSPRPGLLIGGVALFGLLWLRPLFRVRSDPPSLRRGYVVLLTGFLLVIAYALGGLLVLRKQFVPALHLDRLLPVALRIITFAHAHHLVPGTAQAARFAALLPVLSACALLLGLVQILRPVALLRVRQAERAQVETLVQSYGMNTLSYFALTPEKSLFLSSDGRVALSYGLVGRMAVVAGDPIGPQEHLKPALHEFSRFCAEHDWDAVFCHVRAELLPLYQHLGLQALKIGEEAVVDPSAFTLAGGTMHSVRASVRHAEKAGLQTRIFQGLPTDPHLRAQLEQISTDWLARKGGYELGFSLGRFAEQDDPAITTVVALDQQNQAQAFLTFVPVFGQHGWSLDLMRRRELAPSGVIELLLVRALDSFRGQGVQMVSLGLVPLANTCQEQETALAQTLGGLTNRLHLLGQPDSLFRFKRKFQPRWESRYLIYPGTLALPRVGVALLRVYRQRTWRVWWFPHRRREAASTVPIPLRLPGL